MLNVKKSVYTTLFIKSQSRIQNHVEPENYTIFLYKNIVFGSVIVAEISRSKNNLGHRNQMLVKIPSLIQKYNIYKMCKSGFHKKKVFREKKTEGTQNFNSNAKTTSNITLANPSRTSKINLYYFKQK